MFFWLILAAGAALVVGSGAGWLLWGRALAQTRAERDARAAEAQAEHERFVRAIGDLRAEQEKAARVDALDAALAAERGERMAAQTRLAALEAQLAERERALTEQKAQLLQDFEALANSALQQSQQQFLTLADQTLARHRAGSAEELARNKAELESLLGPVRETLGRYETNLAEIEKARAEAYGGLSGQLQSMLADQAQLRAETVRLVHALKSAPKARGRWGEQQLKNVLEMAGLAAYVDFQTEVHVGTDDGALRPDVLIRLPGGRSLVVDAKTSLTAFLEAMDAPDEASRATHLAAHARALKVHADQLGAKRYWDQFKDTADFVVMFVPGEHFVTAALEADPGLWEYAFGKRVLIATPTNLIAIARTVSHVWRQEKLAVQAREIGGLGKELYKRMAGMGDAITALGKSLSQTVNRYNGFVASLEARVMPQARKFAELQLEDGAAEPLPAIDKVEPAVRLPDPGRDLRLTAPAVPDAAE
ncbi:DNA recombination protein RmuC [Parapedomonas caeni]